MTNIDNGLESICATQEMEPCWPFWGELQTVEHHAGIFFASRSNDVFGRFYQIARQSLSMLTGRTIDELRAAAHAIDAAIENWIDLDIEQETENHIRRLARDGGWELGYLRPDASGTEDEIRDLLANWHYSWDEKPDLPERDRYSDLTALQECLDFENSDQKSKLHLGLVNPDEHEFYAVLALMLVCEAVHSNLDSKTFLTSSDLTATRVEAIGHATINAVETIAYAERVQLEQKIRSSIALSQPEILNQELVRRTSERAVYAAHRKYIPNSQAKYWVQQEWALHHQAYSENKSEFSRAYAARVKHEFKDAKGEQLSITEKTIREVWLKDTPTAGK